MSSELKQEMAAYLNLHPDTEEQSFIGYLIKINKTPLNENEFKLRFFNLVCAYADKQDELFKRLANVDLVHPPVIMTSPEQQQFNTAIELLEACSEDLFITGDDKELESRVDSFIKEVKP